MAWYGKIEDFKLVDEQWFALVDYYDDSNPQITIPRSLTWPLGATRTQMQTDIRNLGSQIKNMASINTQAVIGTVIAIP